VELRRTGRSQKKHKTKQTKKKAMMKGANALSAVVDAVAMGGVFCNPHA
jgi:hypothetical protein